MPKPTKAQMKVLREWGENVDWLITDAPDVGGCWFYKDPTHPLTHRVHRWALGGLRFRNLVRFRESARGRDFFELTDEGLRIVREELNNQSQEK